MIPNLTGRKYNSEYGKTMYAFSKNEHRMIHKRSAERTAHTVHTHTIQTHTWIYRYQIEEEKIAYEGTERESAIEKIT